MESLSGVVLAGGRSQRFGSDKASALLAGRPLLQWVVNALGEVCVEIIVSMAPQQALPTFNSARPTRVVEDEQFGRGPLAGLVAGLKAVRTPLAFVASCDSPLLRPGAVTLFSSRAAGHDIVCAEIEGRLQPLGAVFRPESCLPVLRRALAGGELKLTAAFVGLDIVRVSAAECRAVDADLGSFMNVNRPEDLVRVEAVLAARPPTPST